MNVRQGKANTRADSKLVALTNKTASANRLLKQKDRRKCRKENVAHPVVSVEKRAID